MRLLLGSATLLIALFFFLPARQTVIQGEAMTIPYRIILDDQGGERIVQEVFAEINSIFNSWNPNSEISRLNQTRAGEKFTLSPKLQALLQLTSEIVILTEGRFDPTVEPLWRLYKTHLENGTLPPREAIDNILPAIGWDKLQFDGNSVTKKHDAAQINLDGISKGLAVDLLTERLVHAGFKNFLVEWGGELRAAGQHPSNRPWTVFVSNLGDTNPSHAIAHIPLQNEAIATSGDYQQIWTVQGIRYTHIIDPLKGEPLRLSTHSIASATVLNPTCARADALATALMLFPSVEEAEQFAKAHGLTVWIVARK